MIKANLGLFIFSIFKFLDNYLNEKKEKIGTDMIFCKQKLYIIFLKQFFELPLMILKFFQSRNCKCIQSNLVEM